MSPARCRCTSTHCRLTSSGYLHSVNDIPERRDSHESLSLFRFISSQPQGRRSSVSPSSKDLPQNKRFPADNSALSGILPTRPILPFHSAGRPLLTMGIEAVNGRRVELSSSQLRKGNQIVVECAGNSIPMTLAVFRGRQNSSTFPLFPRVYTSIPLETRTLQFNEELVNRPRKGCRTHLPASSLFTAGGVRPRPRSFVVPESNTLTDRTSANPQFDALASDNG